MHNQALHLSPSIITRQLQTSEYYAIHAPSMAVLVDVSMGHFNACHCVKMLLLILVIVAACAVPSVFLSMFSHHIESWLQSVVQETEVLSIMFYYPKCKLGFV
ncbi:hypothetical protein M378DRAFT_630140 [Amanita muscaria Koide BX008]|uniref:Uncharacterized protein n=1 Tax=Amanita muscaria (strain Koide BX008) TaxID=946122 RepID=A0A0C2SM08_AMAMK|nr:hypothetical protein M378DRAFT_630140 [Amanita muscaria Koide BX008]